MIMAVVGCSVPAHRGFYGRILLEQVSKHKHIQTCTLYSNFSYDVLVDGKIIDDKWRDLISILQISILEIKELLYFHYDLEFVTVDYLEGVLCC